MSLNPEQKAEVDALRRAGRYEEAATILRRAGDIAGAADLYAAVWQYEEAIALTEEAGLLAAAYRHAIASNAAAEAGRLLEALREHPEQAAEAARYAEAKGRLLDAAKLAESAADLDAAARLFEAAGELFEAGRCHEAQGRYRKAGVLYERRVREVPEDADAALRLGRILAQFGRHEHAVRALQQVEASSELREEALRLMVACFAAMGLEDAAASRLDALRAEEPDLPVTVPEYLQRQFGDPRGLVGGGSEEKLLAGRYRVVRPLGAGATGRVLLAFDGFYDRDVAVKVLTVGAGGVGRDAYVRFAREARVAAGLEHPNVVRVFEFNPDGPFLVMEYMAGGTLEDRLSEDATDLPALPVVRHIALSILGGLDAVHRRGVIHRDLKPANVFFGATGDVKIGDFGVAHLADLGATLTGAMLGTLAYMSPEQITGSRRPDATTDLYALGVILYRTLTGALPFPGPDFVTQHLQLTPKPASAHRPELAPYDDLLAKLFEKEPADRPGGAAAVQMAVEALPWDDLGATAMSIAQGPNVGGANRPSRTPADPAEGTSAEQIRYAELETLPNGAMLARDEVLLRRVRLEHCDEPRLARLRQFAKADNPHLQAVYALQPGGRAVIEQPLGTPLPETQLGDVQRREALAEIRAAVEHMHALGVVHGSVRPELVVVAPGRAVLLIPDETPAEASQEADLRALEGLARSSPSPARH
ncbi:MAG: protein kinase [Myxococcota bacterium]